MVNDADGTVIPEYGNLDITASAGIWTANINGNNDLLYEEVGQAPVITIDSIKGGFGISAVISNVGNAPAEQIPWSIDINGTVFIGSNTNGIIDIPMGSSVTVKSGLIFGFGNVEVTVTTNEKSQSINMLVLGPIAFIK